MNFGQCIICYDELNESTNITKTPCGHLFCFKCIIKAFQINPICPYCRASLVEKEDKEDKEEGEESENEDDESSDDDDSDEERLLSSWRYGSITTLEEEKNREKVYERIYYKYDKTQYDNIGYDNNDEIGEHYPVSIETTTDLMLVLYKFLGFNTDIFSHVCNNNFQHYDIYDNYYFKHNKENFPPYDYEAYRNMETESFDNDTVEEYYKHKTRQIINIFKRTQIIKQMLYNFYNKQNINIQQYNRKCIEARLLFNI